MLIFFCVGNSDCYGIRERFYLFSGTPSYGPAASFLQSAGQANIISQVSRL